MPGLKPKAEPDALEEADEVDLVIRDTDSRTFHFQHQHTQSKSQCKLMSPKSVQILARAATGKSKWVSPYGLRKSVQHQKSVLLKLSQTQTTQ